MPRGIAIPQLRQQLFTAVETLILRPDKLTGRAVTTEAGVAAGLLYAHFTDLDEFLTAYAVDRTFTVSAAAAALPQPGLGDPAGNISATLQAIPRGALAALARLQVLRPDLAPNVQAVLGDKGFDAIERSLAAYLKAEGELERFDGDPEALAPALVAVLHHTALTGDERLARTVEALVSPGDRRPRAPRTPAGSRSAGPSDAPSRVRGSDPAGPEG